MCHAKLNLYNTLALQGFPIIMGFTIMHKFQENNKFYAGYAFAMPKYIQLVKKTQQQMLPIKKKRIPRG